MFRSIFIKYIITFMMIILFCFSMLTAITTLTVNNYAERAKNELLTRSTVLAAGYIHDRLCSEEGSLEHLVLTETVDIGWGMKTIAGYSNDLTILITDTEGYVFLSVTLDAINVYDDLKLSYISTLPDDDTPEVSICYFDVIDGMFEHPQIAGAADIYDPDGSVAGYVFVCSSPNTMKSLRSTMIKAIFMSSLWVMLAAFIAVYIITNKVTAPLKDMSRAAKSFASGDFSVRVPVKGHDEVSELAKAFNNMANSLESGEKMRNSFMANVSHDLRTPMTTIAGFIDGILDGAIPPEKHEYYLKIITVEVKRLSRLVSQLLDISRIQAGDRKFNMQPFDVCEVARRILISFEQKISEKKLDVEFDADGEYMYAEADSDAIYQILYNLCDNAVKFSNEKGKLRLSLKYSSDQKKIEVEVFNEGQGIRPEDMPYVFERFYKGDKSRGLDKSGVGLGLYISKTIIDAHHESISVESEYGSFCRFRFTLANVRKRRESGTDDRHN